MLKYGKKAERAKELGYQVVKSNDKLKYRYKGLALYESEKMPRSWRLWVPQNRSEYKTKLGNPPMFSCFSSACTLTLDQGNGWAVRATFNEAALNDWRNFYVQFNRSITELMR